MAGELDVSPQTRHGTRMKTRCPACGAENSLDALIAGEEAREALWSLAQIGGPMTRGLAKYLGLFRPAKSGLSHARMATLMGELLPDIEAQRIQRDGKVHPAPPAAWTYGFAAVVAARDSGSLKTPLKSHGYLYQVIAAWRGQADGLVDAPAHTGKQSQMVGGLKALEAAKHG